MKIKLLMLLTIITLLYIVNIREVNAGSYLTEDDIGFNTQEREFNSEYSYVTNGANKPYSCRFLIEEYDIFKDYTINNNHYVENTKEIFSIIKLREFNSQNYYFEFNFEKFNSMWEEQQKITLRNLRLSDLYNSIKTKDRNRILKLIDNNSDLDESIILDNIMGDIKPDLVGGYYMYKPFEGFIGTLLALVAIILIILLTASFIIDLAYMVLPMSIERKPKFVSKIAYNSAKEVLSNKDKKQMMLPYIKDRFITFGVVITCILYLAMGKIISSVLYLIQLFE